MEPSWECLLRPPGAIGAGRTGLLRGDLLAAATAPPPEMGGGGALRVGVGGVVPEAPIEGLEKVESTVLERCL